YLGCFTDAIPRVIDSKTEYSTVMTREICADFCTDYAFYGVQYSTHCFCGNSFETSTKSVDESECNGKCGGSSDICGGYGRNSLFVK
ncbi:hypothetical protein COCCADRAFT_43889, partial [Bipolaris zeicola 26-R-13]